MAYRFKARSVTPGDYNWIDGTFSLVYSTALDTSESIHYQCLEAAQTRIRSLALVGIASANVVVKKLPIDRLIARKTGPIPLPCILLTPRRQVMDPKQGVTSMDDVMYPILCTIVATDNQEPTLVDGLTEQTLWIERIAKAFRNQRLPGVSSIVITSVDPQDVVAPRLWTQNVLASGLLLKFVSREPRGLT